MYSLSRFVVTGFIYNDCVRDIDVIVKKIIIFVVNVIDDSHATRLASIRVAWMLSFTS